MTLGLSDLPISAMHPTELICSVRPEQIEAARFLLASAVRVAVDGGGVLTLGATIANPTPILAGTQICGVLLTAGLFFDDFDLVGDEGEEEEEEEEEEEDTIGLHVITLVPHHPRRSRPLHGRGREAVDVAIDRRQGRPAGRHPRRSLAIQALAGGEGDAAVARDRHGADEAGGGRGEEDGEGGDVLGLAEPADGGARDEVVAQVIGHRAHQRRGDQAGKDRVGCDASRPNSWATAFVKPITPAFDAA